MPCDELVPYIMPAMKARALKVFTVTLYTNASLEELLVELPQTKLEELGCCLSFCKVSLRVTVVKVIAFYDYHVKGYFCM